MFHFSHLLKHLLLHQKMHQLFQGLANGINQVRDLHFFAINTSKFIRNYEHVYFLGMRLFYFKKKCRHFNSWK